MSEHEDADRPDEVDRPDDIVSEEIVSDEIVAEEIITEEPALSVREARRARRRRVRRAEPVAPDPRAPILFAGGVIGAAVLVGIGLLVPPAPGTVIPPPVIEPVDATVLICPEPGGANDAEVTSAIAIVPDLAGQDRPGATTLTYLGKPEEPVDIVTGDGIGLVEPGASVEVVNADGRLRPLVTIAEGGLAPGVVAGQYDLGLSGPRRGLAMLNCPSPAPSWWFVGGGATTGRTTQMYLVNPESSDAEVDISLAGPDGPISTPSLRGLIVPAESRATIRLSRVAPRVPSVAWRVQVRTGRVTASVLDIDAEGFVPRGLDWIPPSAEPATRVYVPGILPGDGRRRLIVHAPGDLDALVQLRVISPDGAYTPIDLPEVEVLAGSVSVLDLTPALQGSAGTLELTSDQPIVASVRSRHEGVDASSNQIREDISFATGATSISTLAAATGLPAVRGTGVTLWLTAPAPQTTPGGEGASAGGDDPGITATIRVLPFGDGSVEPAPIVVDVPYDRAVPVTIDRPENAVWFTATVSPSAGRIYVAQSSLRRGSRGSLMSSYPLSELRTTVSIPSAGRDQGLSVGAEPIGE